MNTPICDFIQNYSNQNPLRLHMPGHKGVAFMGCESADITEIDGADSLYEANGIIAQSEKNASSLFGCDTFYSAEGSSQCIRAMLHLAMLHAKDCGRAPLVAAARNAHKTFASAAALLGFEVDWLYPSQRGSYLSCVIGAAELEAYLSSAPELPAAVYVTSPDYLGSMTDIAALSRVCHRHNVLLLADNAHGAYLRFLPSSLHPIDLGADMCCDSAHKTLPVLTGGAYLHMSSALPQELIHQAKNALALFGSTSPSYLILSSLDNANRYLSEGYREKLAAFVTRTDELKIRLASKGFRFCGDEPLKLTIDAKAYGYEGYEMADILSGKNIMCEFADPDFTVCMLTPELGSEALATLEDALCTIEPKIPSKKKPPVMSPPEKVMSIREAMLSRQEELDVAASVGRVLAAASVGCPPAVPIVVCGERIDSVTAECMQYYGIEKCCVVK